MHAAAETQDTADSVLFCDPGGLALCIIAQLFPFQTSTNVARVLVLLPELPTAVQTLAEVQDTPESQLTVAPAGFGVRWMAQLEPKALVESIPIAQTSPTTTEPTLTPSI